VFPADFYSVAMQVLVALLVIVGIELRLIVRRPDEDALSGRHLLVPVLTTLGLVATAAIGVTAAGVALYEHREREMTALLVFASGGALLVALTVMSALAQAVPREIARTMLLWVNAEDELERTREHVERLGAQAASMDLDRVRRELDEAAARYAAFTTRAPRHAWIAWFIGVGITFVLWLVPLYAVIEVGRRVLTG
jgi:hypothetical protein